MAAAQTTRPGWHLVTGEYPPQPGGVSDYTRQLAEALASAGENVHVWAPARVGAQTDGLAIVHGLPGFGLTGLRRLSQGLATFPGRRRLLIQYVPTAYGYRGLNLPFALWLASRQDDDVWVHFHEVAHGFAWTQRPRLTFLAAVEWWMAQLVAGRADRILISVPGWRGQLGRYGVQAEVLPIPSNVAVDTSSTAVAQLRASFGPGSIVGHFGTYGAFVARLLAPVVVSVLEADPNVRFLLVGRGGLDFVRRIKVTYPHLGSRLIAPGDLEAADVSSYLSACDVLVQPFPDGVSGRRTTAMAGLALGKPVVTTSGCLTEEDWGESGAVILIPSRQPDEIARAVLQLLADPSKCEALGSRATALYRSRFSIEHTLRLFGVDRRSR